MSSPSSKRGGYDPTVLATIVLVSPFLYFASYYALVRREPQAWIAALTWVSRGQADGKAHYRIGGEIANKAFYPVHVLDRKVRPEYWDGPIGPVKIEFLSEFGGPPIFNSPSNEGGETEASDATVEIQESETTILQLPSWMTLLASARNHEDAGNVAAATSIYRALQKESVSDSPVHKATLGISRNLRLKHQYREALEVLWPIAPSEAARAGDSVVAYEMAMCYLALNERELALRCLQVARDKRRVTLDSASRWHVSGISFDPDPAHKYNLALAELHLQLGQMDEARWIAEQALNSVTDQREDPRLGVIAVDIYRQRGTLKTELPRLQKLELQYNDLVFSGGGGRRNAAVEVAVEYARVTADWDKLSVEDQWHKAVDTYYFYQHAPSFYYVPNTEMRYAWLTDSLTRQMLEKGKTFLPIWRTAAKDGLLHERLWAYKLLTLSGESPGYEDVEHILTKLVTNPPPKLDSEHLLWMKVDCLHTLALMDYDRTELRLRKAVASDTDDKTVKRDPLATEARKVLRILRQSVAADITLEVSFAMQ